MNRLVLIGNGFDLAHGLKTSYHDFIEDFWYHQYFKIAKAAGSKYSDEHFTIDMVPPMKFMTECKGNYSKILSILRKIQVELIFKNNYLGSISELLAFESWTDLEKEFYSLLTCFLKSERIKRNVQNKYPDIKALNQDFSQARLLLINYLQNLDLSFSVCDEIYSHIYSGFTLADFTEKVKNDKIVEHFDNLEGLKYEMEENPEKFKNDNSEEIKIIRASPMKNFRKGLKEVFLARDAYNYKLLGLLPQNIMLLNFNYTNTTSEYCSKGSKIKYIHTEINHIHGDLRNMDENPIIFGFGDEMDANYKDLESLDDNKYLEFNKSIAYLRTSNYKKLLEFIESDVFQVSIMGHSCGLSDRTMLNTIFEHENCQSIKPYYHLREDGTDNYNDIVRSISRHFKDKAKMRDRVVNKTQCEPLINTPKKIMDEHKIDF